MQNPTRCSACAVALLFAFMVTVPSVRGDDVWDLAGSLMDPLNASDVWDFLMREASVARQGGHMTVLIDYEFKTGILCIETDRGLAVGEMSERELMILLVALEEAGFELVAEGSTKGCPMMTAVVFL